MDKIEYGNKLSDEDKVVGDNTDTSIKMKIEMK